MYTSGLDVSDKTMITISLSDLDALVEERAIKLNLKKNTTKSRKGAQWTMEEDNRLVKLFGAGTSVFEMSEIHKRTPTAIKMRLIKRGLINVV